MNYKSNEIHYTLKVDSLSNLQKIEYIGQKSD